MRVVSLNIDLPDLIVVKRAVDAYLSQCPCRQKRAGDCCENCRSLEATLDDIARLAAGPRRRAAAPLAPDSCRFNAPDTLVPLGFGGDRPRLTVVPSVEVRR